MEKVDKLSQTQELRIVRKDIKHGLKELSDKYLAKEKPRPQQVLTPLPSNQ